MGRIGLPELILILVVFVLLFGAQKLPELGAAMGRAIREFKKTINDVQDDVKKPLENNQK
jgi:sec-independent protein translocase protein TatA